MTIRRSAAGLRILFEKALDIQIVGEAADSIEAQRLVSELQPRILLLDLKMPGFSAAKLEKWVRLNYPETITLILTAHDRDAYLADMMEAGAVGYLDKKEPADRLIDAIRRAARGEILFDEKQLARVRAWRETVGEKWELLTGRERGFSVFWLKAQIIRPSLTRSLLLPRRWNFTSPRSFRNWLLHRARKLKPGCSNTISSISGRKWNKDWGYS